MPRKTTTQRAISSISRFGGDVRDRSVNAYEATRDKVEDVDESITSYIKSNPRKSVLIAAAAGVAVGAIAIVLMKPKRKGNIY